MATRTLLSPIGALYDLDIPKEPTADTNDGPDDGGEPTKGTDDNV